MSSTTNYDVITNTKEAVKSKSIQELEEWYKLLVSTLDEVDAELRLRSLSEDKEIIPSCKCGDKWCLACFTNEVDVKYPLLEYRHIYFVGETKHKTLEEWKQLVTENRATVVDSISSSDIVICGKLLPYSYPSGFLDSMTSEELYAFGDKVNHQFESLQEVEDYGIQTFKEEDFCEWLGLDCFESLPKEDLTENPPTEHKFLACYNICFTGEMEHKTIEEWKKFVIDKGAIVSDSCTSDDRKDVFVFGKLLPYDYPDDFYKSMTKDEQDAFDAKLKLQYNNIKAVEYFNVESCQEDEFCKWLERVSKRLPTDESLINNLNAQLNNAGYCSRFSRCGCCSTCYLEDNEE